MPPRRILSILVFILLVPVAYCETLTLDQALEQAISNNPALQATRARLGITEAEIVTAGARLNPSILSDNGVAEKTYRLGIEQTFRLGAKRRKQVSLAQAQRDVLLAEINTATLDLRTDVRQAYTRLFNAQTRLKAAEEIVVTNERLVSVAEKRETAGDIANLEVQQTRLALLRSKNAAQIAYGEIVQARTALNALLKQPLATNWTLTPPPGMSALSRKEDTSPEPLTLNEKVSGRQANLETLVQDALSRRPEVQENARQMTVAERQLDLAKANRIPDVTIAAGPDAVVEPGQEEFNTFVVASIPVPLFNRQQGPILEAKARRIQLEAQQAALQNRIVSEVTSAFTAIILNHERILRFETELLPAAEKVVAMSQRSYEMGKSNVLVPLNAQQAYFQTRLEYFQTLEDYQDAISDLERAVGAGL